MMRKFLVILGLCCYGNAVFANAEPLTVPPPYNQADTPFQQQKNTYNSKNLTLSNKTTQTSQLLTQTTTYDAVTGTLDFYWGPRKIIFNSPNTDMNGKPVMCNTQIQNTSCRNNSLYFYTDTGEKTQMPLDANHPAHSVVVTDYNKTFYIRTQGGSPCVVNVSCNYVSE